jgi:flavin reductase (DIM6/NTAB) family NADH-FMN oxidoreductase RutF
MTPERFAEVLRKFPLPVTVVTVGRGGAENALTVSWAAPVSFDPPQFLFAVDRLHWSVEFLRSTRNFAVNLLREGEQKLAGHFARQSVWGEEKLDAVETHESDTGAPVLAGAAAYLDCEVAQVIEVGDHLLVVGRVVAGEVLDPDAAALTTAASGLRYAKVASPAAADAAAPA